MSFPETRAGHDVRLVIHAHVMADSPEDALRLAVEGLRKQTRVQLTSIVPVGDVPGVEDVYTDPDDQADQRALQAAPTGVYTPPSGSPHAGDPAPIEQVTLTKRQRKEQRKGALRHRLCENHTVLLEWDECSPGFVGCTHKRKRQEQEREQASC